MRRCTSKHDQSKYKPRWSKLLRLFVSNKISSSTSSKDLQKLVYLMTTYNSYSALSYAIRCTCVINAHIELQKKKKRER